MIIKTATDHYLGKNGKKRVNCAQTILKTFQNRFDIKDNVIDEFEYFGGGRAPGGVCGALYAGKELLKSHDNNQLKKLESHFETTATYHKCKQIRINKTATCITCVKTVAEFIQKMD